MTDNIVNDIRSKMLEVTRLMNQAREQGIRIEFNVGQNQAGEHVLSFKALKEMKLD